MSEIAGKETRGRGKMHGDLNQKGKRRRWKQVVEGVNVDPNGRERRQVKNSRRQSEAPGEEGEEIKSPKRTIVWVES